MTDKNMAKTTIIQFRMDSDVKESFEGLVKNMGLDMGSAFRIFAMQVINTQKIPFEIRALDMDTAWTKENEKAWRKAREELENGEAISHEEMKKALGL